jgi:F0F1-type ATP synthase epsilon subunit
VQNQEEKKYFVEEGTVEFSNNKLLILTSTAKDLVELDQNFIEDLLNQSEKKLSDDNFSDKEKYLLSYKISTLREISQ